MTNEKESGPPSPRKPMITNSKRYVKADARTIAVVGVGNPVFRNT